ncbi:MAG TPA: XRE family transcriptional regulator [Pseudonocardia sp.]|jgi:transcriptional regulator with XRE-family HTH domain|uniref:helix-turn-helix domain-containing protein n=1 Tax=Pseudonocardia sp. TaxID=60912 RepID=UPI002D1796F2|nr:XRE family transcriptional regulator [Pseudonocardia sp.]HTF48158.1 XRE family transcriptional regulator [Pseudonocardia sp.]
MDVRDDDQLNQLVGATVRALREKAGLSMRALAASAGVSQPFLSQVERGVSAPSMSTVYRLATALGVVPGDLLPTLPHDPVTVVRASEGQFLPVTERVEAARGRILMSQSDRMLELIEYRIEPGQYLEEWFESQGEMALYVVQGSLDVELEGHGSWRLHSRDLIYHPGLVRHRWLLVNDRPVQVLLVVGRPVQT